MNYERIIEDERRLGKLLSLVKLKKLGRINPVCLSSIDSTQSFIANVMKSKLEGDLVLSRVQTVGKGREERTWFSQEGGLWMTITLMPPRSELVAPIPSIATSSIIRTLSAYGVQNLAIKLPNDVYCSTRKIAGVLADAIVKGTDSIVYLGMGVNLNNDPTTIAEISNLATSAKSSLGREIDIIEFASSLVVNLDDEYARRIGGL